MTRLEQHHTGVTSYETGTAGDCKWAMTLLSLEDAVEQYPTGNGAALQG